MKIKFVTADGVSAEITEHEIDLDVSESTSAEDFMLKLENVYAKSIGQDPLEDVKVEVVDGVYILSGSFDDYNAVIIWSQNHAEAMKACRYIVATF